MIDEAGVMDGDEEEAPPPECWYCKRPLTAQCNCGRAYCAEHNYNGHCLICALGFGLFEGTAVAEPISGLIMSSLSAAAEDPYIVKPTALQRVRPLPLPGVERVVGGLVRMMRSDDLIVRHRAASVLAITTNSWPTMNPSQLDPHTHGTSLLATDQVRRWLLHTLLLSRGLAHEPTALAILDKLRTADFRDLYPDIQDNLTILTCSNLGTRVHEVFDALEKYYPTHSHLANERCELIAYEHYSNGKRGAGKVMERLYGPLMKYSPILSKMLKKGTWLVSQARFEEWYYGESEPT